jgi:hypothetical protein
MAVSEHAQDDLQFVRQIVQRAESPYPPALYVLWAAIMLTGGVLGDFRPLSVGRYWLAAAPLGFLASGVIGYRWQRRMGQVSHEAGRNESWHWAAMLGAAALAVLLVVAGRLTPHGLGSVILLLAAVTYVQAGIHLHHRQVWVGLFMALAYVVTLFAEPYEWTIAGILIASALLGQVFFARADAAPQ